MRDLTPFVLLLLALGTRGAALAQERSTTAATALVLEGDFAAARAALGTPAPGSAGELLLARAYFLEEAYAKAESVIRSYLKRQPRSADGLALLGAILAGMHREAEAEAALRAAIRLEPAHGSALKQLAFVLHARGLFGEAARQAQLSIEARRDDAESHLVLALACYADHDLKCAIRAAQEAVRLRQDDLDAQILLAQALTDDQQYDNAIFVLKMANDTNLRKGFGSEKPYVLHGQLLIVLGRVDDADTMFTTALHINPQCVPALIGHARLSIGKDDYRGAASYAERARQLDSNNETVMVLLLRAYRELGQMDKARDAAEWLERANQAKMRGNRER